MVPLGELGQQDAEWDSPLGTVIILDEDCLARMKHLVGGDIGTCRPVWWNHSLVSL